MTYSNLQQQLDKQDELANVEKEGQQYIREANNAIALQYLGTTVFALALNRPIPIMVYLA